MKEIVIRCQHKELRETHLLVPHPRNTQKHSNQQIELLAKLIDHQGFRHPIIISELSGFIVAGHARLKAAQLLGYKEVPIDIQWFENEAHEYSFLESDNRIQELAEWDREKFELNVDELCLPLDYDFSLFGKPNLEIMPQLELNDDLDDADDNQNEEEKIKIYKIEVEFNNELEMKDLYDDLLSKGYLAKIRVSK